MFAQRLPGHPQRGDHHVHAAAASLPPSEAKGPKGIGDGEYGKWGAPCICMGVFKVIS